MCFATLLLLGLAINVQLTIPKTYTGLRMMNGLERPQQDFVKNAESTLKAVLVSSLLSYLALWCIKLSFLSFFWRLTSHVTLYRIIWGIALLFTTVFGIVSVAMIPYYCLVGELSQVLQRCSYGPESHKTVLGLKLACALDIVSDVFSKFNACPDSPQR